MCKRIGIVSHMKKFKTSKQTNIQTQKPSLAFARGSDKLDRVYQPCRRLTSLLVQELALNAALNYLEPLS